jgi:hypothetical protein
MFEAGRQQVLGIELLKEGLKHGVWPGPFTAPSQRGGWSATVPAASLPQGAGYWLAQQFNRGHFNCGSCAAASFREVVRR